MVTMAVQLESLFRSGGEPLIRFLDYCVLSMQPAPIFAFLATQYRFQPTIPGALALYDVFCAQQAPLRLPAGDALPPYNVHMVEHVEHLRGHWERERQRRQEASERRESDEQDHADVHDESTAFEDTGQTEWDEVEKVGELGEQAEADRPSEDRESSDWWPLVAPRRELFDRVVSRLDDSLATAINGFDPSLPPMENIPGGRLGQGQLAFVENVWKRSVRPQLVYAGFWRIANVGGN